MSQDVSRDDSHVITVSFQLVKFLTFSGFIDMNTWKGKEHNSCPVKKTLIHHLNI